MLSGYGLHGGGLELDAIAAAVIGGTLSSWWTKIATAFLLFIFIVIQSLLVINRESKKSAKQAVKV